MRRHLSFVALISLFCGCSKPPEPEKSAAQPTTAPATPPKPTFDFGATDLSPATGTGSDATFRVTVKPGSQKPLLFGLLINNHQNGAGACYVFRNLVSNDNMLVADSGAGAVPLGKGSSVSNAQCELLRDGTGSTQDASGIVVTFHVRFKPSFHGARQVWLAPEDGVGNGPPMKLAGSWTVQ